MIRNGLVQLAACCWLLGFGVLLTPPVVETFCLDLLLSWVSRNDDRLDMPPVDTKAKSVFFPGPSNPGVSVWARGSSNLHVHFVSYCLQLVALTAPSSGAFTP